MELHPAGFVETGTCSGCDGPRYVPIQPSRETPGILLADKYITEFDKIENMSNEVSNEVDFNLPFRNSIMYSKQLQNNFEKLDADQQAYITNMLNSIGSNGPNGPNSSLRSRALSSLGSSLSTDGLTGDNVGNHLDTMYADPSLKSGMDTWIAKHMASPGSVVLLVFVILLCIGAGFAGGFYYHK